MKTISLAETRKNFCSLASDVIESGESIVISRYGTPSLILMKYTPEAVTETPKERKQSIRESPIFGMWADREDMADPRAWIENMRAERRKRWE